MEKNYSYVSPELDWVEVDSSMCCAEESDKGSTVKPGGGGGLIDPDADDE